MQEQEIHDLVASVLDALKTQQAFPAPSVGQGGRLSAMQSEQRPLTGSGAEPELLAEPLMPIQARRWKIWAAPLSVSLVG